VSGVFRSRGLRRVGAVLAGFFTVLLLSVGTDAALHAARVFPPPGQRMSDGLFVLATAYRIVYTVLGGYVTARLAPDAPLRHAVLLGVVGTVAGTAGLVATWNAGPEFGPRWYPVAVAGTALPCCWWGGRIFVGRAVETLKAD
jgi:hypothetical protein